MLLMPAISATILLVEDDEAIRDVMQDVLESAGYDVIPARSGKQAIDYLAAADETPALILLDLMLPLISGWELLRMVRGDRRSSEVPIVVITAVGRDRPTGIQDVLRKPFPVDQLLEVVSRFADRVAPPCGPSVGTGPGSA